MNFFEFVSTVQKHFKNCEIATAQFAGCPLVQIKPDAIDRFKQVALVNGCALCNVDFCQSQIVCFTLDGIRFICDSNGATEE